MQENEKAKKERLTKDWKNAGILNHFIFGRVMENKEICKQFLEMVLKKEIEKIEVVEVEKHLKEFIDTRAVRLDVYAKGESEVFNIELQAKNYNDIAKRSKAHITNIYMNSLKPGDFFKDAKNIYVIFVCSFDPVGINLAQYTAELRIAEHLETRFDDGTQIILLNAKEYIKAENKDLKAFLNFINGNEDIDNPFVNKVKTQIDIIKNNEEAKEKFMSLSALIQDERFEAKQEGIDLGRHEEKEENAISLLKSNKLSFEDIAEILKLSLERVKELHKLHCK